SSQYRTQEVDAYGPGVATRDKAAAGRHNVRKRSSADTDLEHTSIERALEGEVVTEGQLSGRGGNRDAGCIERVVGYATRIVVERRVWSSVARCVDRGPVAPQRTGAAGCTVSGSVGERSYPSSGKSRSRHAVEVLLKRRV